MHWGGAIVNKINVQLNKNTILIIQSWKMLIISFFSSSLYHIRSSKPIALFSALNRQHTVSLVYSTGRGPWCYRRPHAYPHTHCCSAGTQELWVMMLFGGHGHQLDGRGPLTTCTGQLTMGQRSAVIKWNNIYVQRELKYIAFFRWPQFMCCNYNSVKAALQAYTDSTVSWNLKVPLGVPSWGAHLGCKQRSFQSFHKINELN